VPFSDAPGSELLGRVGRSSGRLAGTVALTAAAVALLLTVAFLPLGASANRFSQILADVQVPKARPLPNSTFVYDRYGHLLTVFHGAEDRRPIPFSRIPKVMREAVISAEDEHFYTEGAVNFRSTLRAAWVDLVRHGAVQGGSTITQQYVKDVYTGSKDTIGRKIREALIAQKLNTRLTKNQILARYLNEVYFGHGAYGIQAAALAYFGVPAHELKVAQAAVLAGIIAAPSQFDPLSHPRHARMRRDYVLQRMVADGYLTGHRARRIEKHGVRLSPARQRPDDAPYFMNYVTQALEQRFGVRRTLTGGLRVQTTIDPRLQAAADAAVRSHLSTQGDPSAALVSIDPSNGEVRAMVGGANFAKAQFNLATQAHRQAGSSFKPFTLATAMTQHISLLSRWNGPPSLVVKDPRCFTTDPKTGVYGPWHVSNYADESAGTMSLLDATANSVNTIFSQVVLDVGPDHVASMAHAMGIESKLQPVCSITLGTQPVTPLEMTQGYATLASGGIRHYATGLTSVRTSTGKQLLRAPSRGTQVLSSRNASLVTYALQGVIQHGTGTAANIGRPAAGKTGTAENFQDAWFCGYVPQLVTCVWVGYPKGEIPMHNVEGFPDVFGGSIPAEIWHDFMQRALAGVPVVGFPRPSLAGYNMNPPLSVGQAPVFNQYGGGVPIPPPAPAPPPKKKHGKPPHP
jgi:membrane peptidoglycan carboxypeptidase